MPNPLRAFQGMRVGLIQEFSSQSQPLTPAKMVQKGSLDDPNGVARAAVEYYLFSVFHWQGGGQADSQGCFRLSFLLVSVPKIKITENVLNFAPDAHTGVALPAVAGFEVFILTSR